MWLRVCVFQLTDNPSYYVFKSSVCLCEYITSTVWDHEMIYIRMKKNSALWETLKRSRESLMMFLSWWQYLPPELLLYEIIYLLFKPPVSWLISYLQSQSIPAYKSLTILSIWKRVWLVNSGCCVCLWVETRQCKELLRSSRFINMKPSTVICFPLRCCGEEEEEKQAEYPKVINVLDIYILYLWCFINRNIAEFMISTSKQASAWMHIFKHQKGSSHLFFF